MTLPPIEKHHPPADAGRGGADSGVSLKEVCKLLGLPAFAPAEQETVRFRHATFQPGQRIHCIGQPFEMLYVANSGFLKTVLVDDGGSEHVLGFPMKGDLIGMDGIHGHRHACETVALTACDVILMPFAHLTAFGRKHPEFEMALYCAMSRALVREQAMAGILGSLASEARVAQFLVNLSERFAHMGYSGRQFNLRMTRQEIGSYLGLTLETVSRTLSVFHKIGLISIDKRAVKIMDLPTLKSLRRLPPSLSMKGTAPLQASRAPA